LDAMVQGGGASSNFLNRKSYSIKCRQLEILVNTKQSPFFENFSDFFSTLFERLSIRTNAVAFGHLAIVAAVIRQDLILCAAKSRLNVFQQDAKTCPV